jgi:hypothetical protein
MLNSKKKIRAMRDKKNIQTLVLSERKILNETKNHNPPPPHPPFKLNGRSLRRQRVIGSIIWWLDDTNTFHYITN